MRCLRRCAIASLVSPCTTLERDFVTGVSGREDGVVWVCGGHCVGDGVEWCVVRNEWSVSRSQDEEHNRQGHCGGGWRSTKQRLLEIMSYNSLPRLCRTLGGSAAAISGWGGGW